MDSLYNSFRAMIFNSNYPEVIFSFKNNYSTDFKANQNAIPFNPEKISKYSEEVQILPYRL